MSDTSKIKITSQNANQIANKLIDQELLEVNGLNKFGKNSEADVNRAFLKNTLLANQIVDNLGKKMVYQEIMNYSKTGYFAESISYFKDEDILSGAGKQFAKPYFMDSGFYSSSDYIPTDARATDGKFAVAQATFNQTDAETGANNSFAYQSTIKWMPGEVQQSIINPTKLAEVLERIRQNTVESFRLRQFHALMNSITSLTFNKTVNSTAADMFDAVIELAEHTRSMKCGTDGYNLLATPAGYTKMLNVTAPEDLIILGNVKFFNKVNRGISPQLFHPDSWNKTVDELGNKIEVGYKLDVKNTFNTTIQSAVDMYLDDTTLIVLDRNAIKINVYYNYEVSSQWINGVMTTTSSIWFTITPIWYQNGMKFICPNLLKLPQ